VPAEEASAADDSCRLHAEYLLSGGASESEFLATASGAASAHARAHGPLEAGFYLDVMNLCDQWDESTPTQRARLKHAVRALARRAVDELSREPREARE
jgi:hypothetical protein